MNKILAAILGISAIAVFVGVPLPLVLVPAALILQSLTFVRTGDKRLPMSLVGVLVVGVAILFGAPLITSDAQQLAQLPDIVKLVIEWKAAILIVVSAAAILQCYKILEQNSLVGKPKPQ